MERKEKIYWAAVVTAGIGSVVATYVADVRDDYRASRMNRHTLRRVYEGISRDYQLTVDMDKKYATLQHQNEEIRFELRHSER